MFRNLKLRGTAGSVSWGYRTAASVRRWTITRQEKTGKVWNLVASIADVDKFQIRQSPLLFTAAREDGTGFWCFPLIDVQIRNNQLHAQLGPPEQ